MRASLVLTFVALTLCCGKAGPPSSRDQAEPDAVTTDHEVASFDGVRIVYTVRGEGEPAIVFVHGWLGNRGHWSAQATALEPSHRVVLVDLAGHGASGTDRATWSLESFGRDVQAVADAAGLERMIVVGHSMGGPVALEAARLMPQRVLAVIAVESLHDPEPEVDRARLDALVAQYVADFRGTCTRFADAMFSPAYDPELRQAAIDGMCGTSPEAAIATMRLFPDYDIGAAMAAVDVPIRIINARLMPTDVEADRSYHADTEAVVIDVPSHYPMLERPEEVTERLRQAIDGVLAR